MNFASDTANLILGKAEQLFANRICDATSTIETLLPSLCVDIRFVTILGEIAIVSAECVNKSATTFFAFKR